MAELVYKPFHETYKIIAFALGVGMMYPNPAREKQRIVLILIISLSTTPFMALILLDMYQSWIIKDIVEIIRHTTVVVPFILVLLKAIVMYFKRIQAKQLIDEINRDYATYITLDKEYQTILSTVIRNSRAYCERAWTIAISAAVMIYPLRAIVLNVYSYTFKFESTRYMNHDVNKPFSDPEARLESPYYEFIFVYTFYCDVLVAISFIGHDGFFGICITHAGFKIEIIWKLLDEALKAENPSTKLIKVIKEQHKLFRFVDTIQDTFNIWLGVVYLHTVVEICTCMYYIVEGYNIDIRGVLTFIATVIHIYLPCRYTTKLKIMSVKSANVIYSSGWENVYDLNVRRMIVLMIARAQAPLEIKAFKIITYDMELFASLMQTSYSMYTLLRSS